MNLVAAGLTTVAITAFGWFLQASHRNDPATARRLLAATRRRVDERHSVTPEANGYTFLMPLFGDHGAPVRDLAAWYDGPRDATERKIDNDPALLARHLEAFDDAALPRVDEALARPSLVLPRRPLFESVSLPITLTSRSIVLGLVVRGWMLEGRGLSTEAARSYLRGIALGGRYMRQDELLTPMLGVGMQQIALGPLAALVASGSLDRAALDEVVHRLSTESHDDRLMVDRVDEKYLKSVEMHTSLSHGEHVPGLPAPSRLQRVIGRLFLPLYNRVIPSQNENDYLKTRARVLDDDLDGLENLSKTLRSLHGMTVGNTLKIMAQMMKARTMVSATAIAAACHAFRHDRGHWPPTLDALVPEYLAELPADFMAPSKRFEYRVEGADFRLFSNSSNWRHVNMQAPVEFPLP